MRISDWSSDVCSSDLADLVELGFDGSYGRVAAFARKWKAQLQYEQQTSGRGTFVPLVFAPGEAFQFDWSEDWAVIDGERVKLQAAHPKLSHSTAFIVREIGRASGRERECQSV